MAPSPIGRLPDMRALQDDLDAGTPLHPATTKPARATLTSAGTCLLM